MTTDPAIEALKTRVEDATLGAQAEETGVVTELADGLAHVSGLPGARLGEVLAFHRRRAGAGPDARRGDPAGGLPRPRRRNLRR